MKTKYMQLLHLVARQPVDAAQLWREHKSELKMFDIPNEKSLYDVLRYLVTKNHLNQEGGKFSVPTKVTTVVGNQTVTKDVKKPTFSEEKETYRLKEEIKQLKKHQKHDVASSALEDKVLSLISREILSLPGLRSLNPTGKKESGDSQSEEAVLLSSDLHIGEVVSVRETNGLAEYNYDIYCKRLRYQGKVISNLRHNKLNIPLTKLTVVCLGDMISGIIHEELTITSEMTIVEQVVRGAQEYANFLRSMATIFPSVKVIGIAAANHPRLKIKKEFKRKWANWDFIFYKMVELHCQNIDNIEFDIPKSLFWVGDICGHKCLALHGDDIRSWMSIPWYGIERMTYRLKSLLMSQGHAIEYIFLGHFHQSGEISDVVGEKVLNGSMIGGNEYSIGALGATNYPCQAFFGMHKKFGRTWRYPLKLDIK